MVTTNGAGLNPNAKVWQEIPAHQNDISEVTEASPWLQTYPPTAEMADGYSDIPCAEGKGCEVDYPDNTLDYVPSENIVNGIDHPDLGYLVFDPQGESAIDGDVSKDQPMSEESLRESLKKQLEFCFSRENLCKDMYLISQMDSDQFVPIWTIACLEQIKALTTDVNLIREVMQASPIVQVDETGEKVRPNHNRCIIILREVAETTPVEEVEALFKNENCPKILSAEFAHNSNWYITFQSDMDALQAYRYLREEVKTFQGKPILARIKAINTFFGKKTFVESSVYSQHGRPQAQYGSPVYMQQVYSPQQQYPVYSMVSPSWSSSVTPSVNPSVMPYFGTPLAPFPNGAFMNGYGTHGSYKANSGSSTHRPMSKNRNHGKGHHKAAEGFPPSASANLMDCLSSPSGELTDTPIQPVSLPIFSFKDTSLQATITNGDLSGGGRGRRGNHRGMRRKREDEHTMRSVSLMEPEVPPPPPKFDLAASSFPPLPGSVVSIQGEAMPETRLSDVVRGLKVTRKALSKEVNETQPINVSNYSVTPADKPTVMTPPTVAPLISSVSALVKEEEGEDKAPVTEGMSSSSTQAVSPASSEPATSPCSQSVSPEAPLLSPTTSTSEQGPRKLSYAEVCQKMAKDPPPVQIRSPSPLRSSASQPLQELKGNSIEEPRPTSRRPANKTDKDGEGHRHPLRSFRGANGQTRVRGAGLKIREHQRNLNNGKPFTPQRGSRQSGKEQNIPPRSPK